MRFYRQKINYKILYVVYRYVLSTVRITYSTVPTNYRYLLITIDLSQPVRVHWIGKVLMPIWLGSDFLFLVYKDPDPASQSWPS
jgi:hypothetical protein